MYRASTSGLIWDCVAILRALLSGMCGYSELQEQTRIPMNSLCKWLLTLEGLGLVHRETIERRKILWSFQLPTAHDWEFPSEGATHRAKIAFLTLLIAVEPRSQKELVEYSCMKTEIVGKYLKCLLRLEVVREATKEEKNKLGKSGKVIISQLFDKCSRLEIPPVKAPQIIRIQKEVPTQERKTSLPIVPWTIKQRQDTPRPSGARAVIRGAGEWSRQGEKPLDLSALHLWALGKLEAQ